MVPAHQSSVLVRVCTIHTVRERMGVPDQSFCTDGTAGIDPSWRDDALEAPQGDAE